MPHFSRSPKTPCRRSCRLTVDAFNRDNSKKLASGYLLTVDNQIDASTGTSRLKAVFDNKDNALFPNQFVNVRLLVDTENNQTVIPTAAVQRGQQGPFVYIVNEESKVQIRQVDQGAVDGETTVIRKGVEMGEQVVIDGIDRLQNGSTVRVRKPGEDQFGEAPGRGRNGRGRAAGKAGDKAGADKAGADKAGGGEGRSGRRGGGEGGGRKQ